MQMRRLWESLSRRLRSRVGSFVRPGHDARDVGEGVDSRPDVSSVSRRTDDRESDRDLLSSAAAHEDALVRYVVDNFPLDNVTWQSYYLSVAGVGLAFLLANLLHVQPVSGFDTVLPIIVLMGLLAAGGVYQIYTRVVFFAPPP